MTLSSAELTGLYDDLKKFGADALEGRTRLQVGQLRELLLQNIERNEILEAQWREHNPQNPEMQVVNLTVDRKALEAVNEFLRPESSPADEQPQLSSLPKAKKTLNEQPTGITGFKGWEAALYFALTHPAGYGETQAWEDVKQFNTLNNGKDLYNKVSTVKKEDFQEVKGCTSKQRPNWIRRLNNVIPHLHTDEQKAKAKELLQRLNNQQ